MIIQIYKYNKVTLLNKTKNNTCDNTQVGCDHIGLQNNKLVLLNKMKIKACNHIQVGHDHIGYRYYNS